MAITGSDNFNRADNSALGASWTQNRGNHDVAGNRLKTATIATGLNHAAFTGTSPASADYYVRAVKRGGGTGDHTLGVGARQKSAAYGSLDAYVAELPLIGNAVTLSRIKAGSKVQLASQSLGAALLNDQDYVLELRVTGTGATVALTVLVDGVTQLTYDDTSADRITAANYAGVYDTVDSASSSNRVETDDFEFGTLAESVIVDRALVWQVAAGVHSDRALPWHTQASVTGPDRALLWQTRAGLSVDQHLLWQTAAAVEATRALPWHVAGPLVVDQALVWSVAVAVAVDRALVWTVAVPVTADWSAVWSVLVDAATATVDLALAWSVTAAVAADRSLAWQVAAAVAAERAFPWQVALAVTTERALGWRLTDPVLAGDLALAWGVAEAVAAERALAWGVAIAVAPADLALVWHVGRLGGGLATTPVAGWRERAPVGAWG